MTDLVLTSLRKTDEVARHLTSRGLSLDGAHSKAKLFARAANALEAEGHGAASPALGFCIVAVPRTDATISITSVSGGESTAFEFRPDLKPREGHWSNYPISVAARLALNFPGQRNGANMALESDLPAAAGMSSSSALVVATYLALAAGNTFEQRPEFQQHIQSQEDLAGYLGTIENGQSFGSLAGARGVGTFGARRSQTILVLPGPFGAHHSVARRLSVRDCLQWRKGREDRCRDGEVQSRLTPRLGGTPPLAAIDPAARSASGGGNRFGPRRGRPIPHDLNA